MIALQHHPWPGNVRELRNVVERMVILSPEDTIGHVPLEQPVTAGGGSLADVYATLKDFKEAAERDFLLRKLERNNWNISQTAKEIDTPRSNLYKKIESYELMKDRPAASSEDA
jgi:two-component system nitrogen regulation response regulator NtrX